MRILLLMDVKRFYLFMVVGGYQKCYLTFFVR